MSQNVNAEIIAIGTEILLGEITDTNSVFIAQRLRDMGVNLYYMTSVGDNAERIADAIRIALNRADIVITCGGLGPTVDDMTRQGVARAMNSELEFQQALFDQIAARFQMYRVTMTDNNRRQAFLPAKATAIDNPVGTAPAFRVESGDKVVISLPGVPREMKYLMEQAVTPYLLQRYQLGIIKARVLKTAGLGESSLDDRIGNDLLEQANPTVGLAAHHGIIDIRITAKADDVATADTMIAETEARVRERVGRYIFGADKDQLERVLSQALARRNLGLSVIEAGLDHAVIDKLQPYLSDATLLKRADRYPEPEALRTTLGAEASVNLRDLALMAAERYRQQDGSVAAIVIVSLPEINEAADVDMGTAVAVVSEAETKSRVYGFGGQFDLARDWVSRWSMALVWRMLQEQRA